MIWPLKPAFQKQIARIEITGAIASATRKRVLEALKEERLPLLSRVLSRNRQRARLTTGIEWIEFNLSTSGLPLWLYRP